MIDYGSSYHELREWIINLKPYCDTCKITDEERCDDCHRKSIGWRCDPESLPALKEES